eukprot:GFYU01006166.1.p1 GENE.GFYU01006166.1~~GFYU01006166.1.p1  ORF type:complete len:731 (-),score=190.61 GFYU01006166.1:304-2496(-)
MGAIAFFVFGSVFVGVCTTALLWYFAKKNLAWYVYATVFIGWFLSFSIVVLVPADIDLTIYQRCLDAAPKIQVEVNSTDTAVAGTTGNSTSTSTNGTQYILKNQSPEALIPLCGPPGSLDYDVMFTMWSLMYWSTFVLCWSVYPILQSYTEAGEFNFSGKFVRALKENIIFYAIGGLIGLVLLIWIAVQFQLTMSGLRGVCMAASNAYGLLAITLLMGYGLVEIPRGLWYRSNIERRINELEFRAISINSQLNDANADLSKTLAVVNEMSVKVRGDNDLAELMDIVIAARPNNLPITAGSSAGDDLLKGEVDEPVLAALHRRLKYHVLQYRRYKVLWSRLIAKAITLEDSMDNMHNESQTFVSSIKAPRTGKYADKLAKAEWWWKCVVRQYVYMILAVLSGIMSFLVIWSEVFLLTRGDPDLSPFSVMLKGTTASDHASIVFVAFWPMTYMVLCCYWSVFKMKLWIFYEMFPHHQTEGNSLCFNALFVSRFTPPLCYNFLIMMGARDASFGTVMGQMDVVPFFGDQLNLIAPIFIIFISLMTVFNVFGWLMNKMGIKRFQFEEGDWDDDRIVEGRELIARERRLLENKRRRGEWLADIHTPRDTNTPRDEPPKTMKQRWEAFVTSVKSLDAETVKTWFVDKWESLKGLFTRRSRAHRASQDITQDLMTSQQSSSTASAKKRPNSLPTEKDKDKSFFSRMLTRRSSSTADLEIELHTIDKKANKTNTTLNL